jgi:hypothetical protein
MKITTAAALLTTLVLSLTPTGGVAWAAEGHDHDHAGEHEAHEPSYGGVVKESGGLQYELVLRPDGARLYVDDHGEKVSVKGGKVTLNVLKNGQTSRLVLLPAGENYLEGQGALPPAPGVVAVAVVLLRGKTTTIRFAVK